MESITELSKWLEENKGKAEALRKQANDIETEWEAKRAALINLLPPAGAPAPAAPAKAPENATAVKAKAKKKKAKKGEKKPRGETASSLNGEQRKKLPEALFNILAKGSRSMIELKKELPVELNNASAYYITSALAQQFIHDKGFKVVKTGKKYSLQPTPGE